MVSKFKSDKLLAVIAILGVILFLIVSYFIMSSSKSVKAIVLSADTDAGVIVTEDMIQVINVPEKTPVGYLRNPSSVIGYKLKTSVKAGQLLYESNFMSSWTNYADSDKIPEDYVITSLTVPDNQACGGVITAGDYVDIMMVSKFQDASRTWGGQEATATEINGTGRSDTGTYVSYVLANVYVLNTNSGLSESQQSDLSVAQGGSGEGVGDVDGSFYIFALSYDDAKKLRQAEGVKDAQLWLNIAPNQNQAEGKHPLLKQMVGQSYSFLHDAQEPVQDKDGNMLVEDYYVPGEDGTMQKKSDLDNTGYDDGDNTDYLIEDDDETTESSEDADSESGDSEEATEETTEEPTEGSTTSN